MKKLTKGKAYDQSTLEFVGWSDGQDHYGYEVNLYFDRNGRYLGPDSEGIEPLFEGSTRRFAFVSRHEPTSSQLELAAKSNVELVHAGDRDAFSFPADEFLRDGFCGVVVVHPQSALTAFIYGLSVGVFNNVNRAPLGAPPQFETTQFFITEPGQ